MTAGRPVWLRWHAAVALPVAVLVIGVAIAEASGWPFLRGAVQSAVGSFLGAPVMFGPGFELHLLRNPRLEVDKLSSTSANAGDVRLLDAQGLLVRWSWLDLWRLQRGEPLHLRELSAQRLEAHLVRQSDGRANWPQDVATAGVPTFGVLQMPNAIIVIDDAVLDTRLKLEFHGREGTEVAASGDATYEATARGRYRGLPVTLNARSAGALPLIRGEDNGNNDTQSVALQIDGRVGQAQIGFDGQAAALFGAQDLDGTIKLRAGSVGRVGEVLGLTLPETAPFQLQGRLRHAVGVWRLRDVQLLVGRSRIGGDYRFDTRVEPHLLSGRVNASSIRLVDLGPAVGVPVEGQSPADGKVLPRRTLDFPSLGAMDADLRVNVDELDFGTPSLRPVRDLRVHLLLARSVLRFEDVHAQAGGGSLDGRSELDGRRGAADWLAELRFNGLDVASWIVGVRKPTPVPAAGASATVRGGASKVAPADRPATAYLTGTLDGRLHVKGSGRSTASILASLSGSGEATVRNGTVSHLAIELLGIDAAQALGVAIKGDDALPLRCARLDVKFDKGVALPRAVFDNNDSAVRLDGKVDLRDETLALRAITRPKDFTLVALRAPVLITGTLGAPRVEVEAGPVLARAAASVALGVLATPVAALLPLIDPGSKEEGDPCARSASPKEPAGAQGSETKQRP